MIDDNQAKNEIYEIGKIANHLSHRVDAQQFQSQLMNHSAGAASASN